MYRLQSRKQVVSPKRLADVVQVISSQSQSPVTLLFILANRLGLFNAQSISGVQFPSARNVSRILGAVTGLGMAMEMPVPILTAPTLSR